MKTNTVFSTNVWFSPRFPILLFWSLREKIGDTILKSNKFKKEREAWPTAAALLGIIKITNKLWWVQVPEDDPPDMYVMTLTQIKKNNMNSVDYRNIEVMEINKLSIKSIENEIIDKLKDKFYEKETCLLVHIKRDSLIKDMEEMANNLSGKIHNVSDIWLLGNNRPNSNDFILFSVFPEVQVVEYNLDEEMSKLPSAMTLELTKSKGIEIQKVRAPLIWRFKP